MSESSSLCFLVQQWLPLFSYVQHVPHFLTSIPHSSEFSVSSFVHLFFCQCLCFYNEYGSVSLCIRVIQWKTADEQDEQILNFPDMAIANTQQENKKEELFAS